MVLRDVFDTYYGECKECQFNEHRVFVYSVISVKL